MKNKVFLFLMISILAYSSCSKDENSNDLSASNSPVLTTSLTGRILDENGGAVSGAMVQAGGKSAMTDVWGIYFLENVSLNKSRDFIRVNAPGKWNQITGFIPGSATLNYINAGLNTMGNPFPINGVTGGQVNLPGNMMISFPANAFVDGNGATYAGNVMVNAMQLSPDANFFDLLAPGGDFLGNKTNEDAVILLSYGMAGVLLTDNNGNEIKIAPGKKALISCPIVTSHQSAAPATIPLWYLDELTGRWKEEGIAVKSGNTYTGEVSHFTYWNFDDSRPSFTISGSVTDLCGTPVAGVYVAVHSQFPNAGGHGMTNINGNFTGFAPANEPLNIYVGSNWTNNSPVSTLPAQNPSTFYALGSPIILSSQVTCKTRYTGRILNCNNQPKIAPVVFLNQQNNYTGHTWSDVNGNFSFMADTGYVKIITYSGVLYTAIDTMGNPNGNIYLGNVLLCDTINLNNNFQLTFASPFGNIPLSFEVNNCNVNSSTGEISINYTDSASGVNSGFIIKTMSYTPGTYLWDFITTSVSGTIYYAGQNYSVSSAGSGLTTLVQTPAVGGQIIGNFSGMVLLSGAVGNSMQGNLNGSFDMVRNN